MNDIIMQLILINIDIIITIIITVICNWCCSNSDAATRVLYSQLTVEYALLNKQVSSTVLKESIELAARRAAGFCYSS